MSESFAGIEVPQGDPGGLESAAGAFGGLAADLSGAAAQLHGMPAALAGWSGPASVAYAGTCMTNGGACTAAVQAFGHAERAAHRYAANLKDAQQRARQAIADARDAQHRIDQARRDIAAAQDRMSAAADSEAAMAKQAAVAYATGAPAHAFEAARSQAQADGAAAATDLARAQRALSDAEDDLRRAQKRGHDAMAAARDAANSAASAFSAAGSQSPAFAAFGAAAQGAGPGAGAPHDPAWEWAAFWRSIIPFYSGNDDVTHYKWFADQGMPWLAKFAGDGLVASAKGIRSSAITEEAFWTLTHTRTMVAGPAGIDIATTATLSRESSLVIDMEKYASAAKYARGAKVIPYVGGALTIASAGWDQWREDEADPELTTTDRVGRAAGAGVWVGGATVTGAWAGATVGTFLFPGVGTGVGFAIGAGVGLAAGAAANAWTPAKHAFVDAGQWTANKAVDVVHDIGSGLDSVEKHLPHISLPHVSLPHISL